MRSPEGTVELREAVVSDHSRLEELKFRYHMVAERDDAYLHLFERNHLYCGGMTHYPMGWVLETTQRQLVGHIGNIYLDYYLNTKRVITASARAWVVDIMYRGSAFALLRTFCTQPNVDLILITTANLRVGLFFL